MAELLADTQDFELLICGRDGSRARAFCTDLDGSATAIPIVGSRADIPELISEHSPDVVVDASGPFQNYGQRGEDRYMVPRAAIAAGVHYLDLADAAEFVDGIGVLDEAARAAGVFVLAGVSSFPVLTDAVVRELGEGVEVTRVTGGIAPSPYAGMGLNVMRAVLGYAGGPVRLTRAGESHEARGLAESLRYTIAPPAALPLRSLRFSLVDVPDLRVIPNRHPGLRSIWMGAAPLPEFLHRALNVLAWLRSRSLLPSLVPFARLFQMVLDRCRFGEHRGGMFVEIEGRCAGTPVTRSWHMIAEGDDGPYIPSMAVEGVLRKHLAGETPAPGARPASGTLTLADYEALFEGREIRSGFRDHAVSEGASLYQRHLGPAYARLPNLVQVLHAPGPERIWGGRAQVVRGTNPLARLIGWMHGFPPASPSVPVQVRMSELDDGELWERDFGGVRFRSTQHRGEGRDAGLIVEKFGAIRVALAIFLRDDRLVLLPRQWAFLGIPMPRALLPKGESYEMEADGRFCFDVQIRLPLFGLIVSYQGWLEPG